MHVQTLGRAYTQEKPPNVDPNMKKYQAFAGSKCGSKCEKNDRHPEKGTVIININIIDLLTSFDVGYIHQGCWSWGGDVAGTAVSVAM